jgi:hypothetical protein
MSKPNEEKAPQDAKPADQEAPSNHCFMQQSTPVGDGKKRSSRRAWSTPSSNGRVGPSEGEDQLNHEGQRHVKEGKHSTDPGVKER